MQSDNANFYASKMIKVTSGFDFKKTIFSARRRHHPQSSWNIFQIQITPLFWCPQGPQGCLEKRNCPLCSNLAVWRDKIGPKTWNWKLWLLGPILAHKSTKFEISGWFCFSRHPWGPCGRQNSGMKPKSADTVSVLPFY